MALYRKFSLLFQDIIVVGCGGTGSRIIQPLIQTIKQAQASINPCLYLVDGDEVEFKNLSRQNFIEKDIGRNKAVVLAERYSAALEFPVVAHDAFITSKGNMFSEIGISAVEQDHRPLVPNTRKLIIMCVDSIDARLMILNQIGSTDIVIDAGNEDTFGQVAIFDRISVPHLRSTTAEIELPREQVNLKPFSGEYEMPFIPAPITPYLHALVNPPKSTGSCADLDQSLAINNMMAAGIINFVQNLAYNLKFYCRTNYFDLVKGNSSERMTNTWFNQVFNEVTSYTNNHISNWTTASVMRKFDGISTHEGIRDVILRDITSKVSFIDPKILEALSRK